MPSEKKPLRVRFAQALNVIRGVDNAYMGPLQPMPPGEPQTVGRKVDYPVGANINFQPRAYDPVSFQQLRYLADNYDLMRAIIETRKNQMEKLVWELKGTDEDADMSKDPRVLSLTKLFQRPDGRRPWRFWLRELLEEVLVTDAPAVYVRRTNAGLPAAFEIIDGTTIKVLIDAQGRVPIAPDPAYQQILKGRPTSDLSSDELIYLPRNPRVWKFYGYPPVEQIIMTVNIALRRQLRQLQYYTDGNLPDALIFTPEDWTPQQVKQMQTAFDELNGTTAQRRRAKFIPGAKGIHQTAPEVLKDQMDDWLARITCYAFNVPPTAFVPMVNRSTADTTQDTSLEEGKGPLMEWVRELMNHIIQNLFGYTDIEFAWKDEREVDPDAQNTRLTSYVSTGIFTINESRAQLGMSPIDGGDVPIVIGGAGAVTLKSLSAAPEMGGQPTAALPGAAGKHPVTKPDDEESQPSVKKRGVPMSMFRHQERKTVRYHRGALTKEAHKTLRKVADSVAHQMRGHGTKAQAPLDMSVTFDLSDFEGLRAPLTKAMKAVHSDGYNYGHQIAGTADDEEQEALFEQGNTVAADYTRERVDFLLGTKDSQGGELQAATRKAIQRLITEASENGMSEADVADMLETDFAFSANRAMMIARTELRRADAHGNLSAYKDGGSEGKQWLTSPDACPECIANAEQGAIPISDPFASGDEAPPAHPNCRCDIIPANLG